MPTRDDVKRAVCEAIDRQSERIVKVGETIRKHPELGFKEFKTGRLVEETMREIGLEPKGGFVGGQCSRILPLGKQNAAHADVIPGNLWAELERLCEMFERCCVILALISEDTEQVPGIGSLRLAAQNAFVGGFRFVPAAGAMMDDAKIKLLLAGTRQELGDRLNGRIQFEGTSVGIDRGGIL